MRWVGGKLSQEGRVRGGGREGVSHESPVNEGRWVHLDECQGGDLTPGFEHGLVVKGIDTSLCHFLRLNDLKPEFASQM